MAKSDKKTLVDESNKVSSTGNDATAEESTLHEELVQDTPCSNCGKETTATTTTTAVIVSCSEDGDDGDKGVLCDVCRERETGACQTMEGTVHEENNKDLDEEAAGNAKQQQDISTQSPNKISVEDSTEQEEIREDDTPMEEVSDTSEQQAVASSEEQGNDSNSSIGEETWVITKVMPMKAVTKKNAVKCSNESCSLVAACIYVSNMNPDEEWNYCLDCQENDYNGWPEDPTEIPISSMTDAHKVALVKNCSKNPNIAMPVFPDRTPSDAMESELEGETSKEQVDEPLSDNPNSEPKKVNKEEQEGEPETWAITKVMSIKDVAKKNAVKCSNESCDLMAACIYVSNLNPEEEWNSCLDCQESDFGGWPDDSKEIPISSMTDAHKASLAKNCSKYPDIAMPVFLSGTTNAASETDPKEEVAEEAKDEGEAWDVTSIMSIESVLKHPVKCSYEHCMLPAACMYTSNQNPPSNFYYCLDCQVVDYQGWPDPSELPVKYMTEEHKAVLVKHCSKKSSVVMPDFPSLSPAKTCENSSLTLFTPPPHGTMTQAIAAKQPGEKNIVTPHPGSAKLTKAAKKPTKKALEVHRQWQAEAEKFGGPGTRIEVSKPAAKKLIFDFLFDKFFPMNITGIFKGLKGVVPQPILKLCLDDMCASPMHRANMFVESDDEEEKKEDEGSSKKARDPYAGSLVLKSSRTPAAGLYYVDYNKAKNGNGLDGNEYNELAAQDATTKAEESALLASINAKTSEAKKLLSEPTNQELALRLDEGESALAKIQGEVEEARKLQVNEKHKNGIKRRRDNMVTQWRKRRRMCMEILINLEELSDGKISSKKCLDGDGQIDIDSDDVVAKYAVEYGKKKRANPVLYKKRRLAMRKTNAPTSSAGLPASEDFVAVKLDSQGQVYRVLLPDEDSK